MTLVFLSSALKAKLAVPSLWPSAVCLPLRSSHLFFPSFFFLLRCLEKKSMFHMLHYISIIKLVLKSSTLIIYCASCKWSIHMEPSFSTFLMLFPGYKLQENISYSKEGNALNECRWGILHKGGNQEPFRKKIVKVCSLGCETHGSGGFQHPLVSGEGWILWSGEAAIPPKFPSHSMEWLPKQEPHPYGGPHQDVHLKCHQTLRSLA